MNKSIAITVLTWNDWENTIICLESIFQNTYQNFDVVLINNGSEKHHIEKIKDWALNKIEVSDNGPGLSNAQLLSLNSIAQEVKYDQQDRDQNLVGLSDESLIEKRVGVGIVNTRERIDAFFGKKGQLSFHAAELTGLIVRVLLPLQNSLGE